MKATDQPGTMTSLLARWRSGDEAAFSEVAAMAYQDLRSVAARFLRRERPGHTLQATGLVNELYLRLRAVPAMDVVDGPHFFALAARVMRRILVDHARRATAQKRPTGGERVPLHEELAWVDAVGDDVIDLDAALDALADIDERKVRAIECRYFLGCSESETAEVLGVSRSTVGRDLDFAKAWLYRRLHMAGDGERS